MPVSDLLLSQIDFEFLLKRLTACAAKWFLQRGCSHPEDILPATAKSAVEIVYDTTARFIEGEFNFEPKESGEINQEIYLFLKKVMWRNFLDLVKKGRANDRTTVMDVTASGSEKYGKDFVEQTLDSFPSEEDLHFETLNKAIVARRVLPIVDGDQKLEQYIRAVLELGCIKREDIAAVLKISPQEATNHQRSLRTKLAVWARNVNSDRSNS